MASEVLFVLSETWINNLSGDRTRARTIAIYTTSLSLGFAAGPLILSIVGSDRSTPYLVGAGLALQRLRSLPRRELLHRPLTSPQLPTC